MAMAIAYYEEQQIDDEKEAQMQDTAEPVGE